MGKQDQINEIKILLGQFITEKVESMSDSAMVNALNPNEEWTSFEKRLLEGYHGEGKVPFYILKEFMEWLGKQHNSYNAPYWRNFTAEDWVGNAPNLTITIPSDVHNLSGMLEVNVYDESKELVLCDVEVTENENETQNVIIKSATKFAGKIDIFCNAGETPDLIARQPVFMINGEEPDGNGNIDVYDSKRTEEKFEEVDGKFTETDSEIEGIKTDLLELVSKVEFDDNRSVLIVTFANDSVEEYYIPRGGGGEGDFASYTKTFTDVIEAPNWVAVTGGYAINISAATHNLPSPFEVNVYDVSGELVECDITVVDKNITVKSAIPFAGSVDVFCGGGGITNEELEELYAKMADLEAAYQWG